MSDWKPPKHGPPGSLLRALQRGSGGGHLRALKAPPEHVQQMLLSFAEEDPRWDHQIERRTEYWGDLAVAVELPAEPLGEIALRLDHRDDERDHNGDHYPALGMLGQMAARGRADAIGALARHVEFGFSWDDAIRELEVTGLEAMAKAAEALVRRFGPGTNLRDALAKVSDRWEAFEDLAGPAGDAARGLREEHKSREREPRQPQSNLSAMTLEELRVYADNWETANVVAEELRRRKTPFNDLTDWLRPGRSWVERCDVSVNGVSRRMAFRRVSHAAPAALKAMRGSDEPALFTACAGIVEAQLRRPVAYGVRANAMQILCEGPARLALPIARRWWSAIPRLQGSALDILAVHGESQDIQKIVPVLGKRFTPGTHYLIDGALDVLVKHPEYGPFPELESLYHRAAMSCTRERTVKLMALTEPGFTRGLAFECLWDAEPGIRLIATAAIDLTIPGARERLEFIAEDHTGSDDLRNAAQQRLARG